MNKTFYILMLLLAAFCTAAAKGQSALYTTFADYKNNKPLFVADSASGMTGIHLHRFFWNQPTVAVLANGSRHIYKKAAIYGYTDEKRHLYRFYKNEEYLLAEAGGIYIYTRQSNITQNKGFVVVTNYYFSTMPDSDIMRLDAANLWAAYAGNERFLALLETHLNTGSLHQYDSQHHMYKLNYIFQESANK